MRLHGTALLLLAIVACSPGRGMGGGEPNPPLPEASAAVESPWLMPDPGTRVLLDRVDGTMSRRLGPIRVPPRFVVRTTCTASGEVVLRIAPDAVHAVTCNSGLDQWTVTAPAPEVEVEVEVEVGTTYWQVIVTTVPNRF